MNSAVAKSRGLVIDLRPHPVMLQLGIQHKSESMLLAQRLHERFSSLTLGGAGELHLPSHMRLA